MAQDTKQGIRHNEELDLPAVISEYMRALHTSHTRTSIHRKAKDAKFEFRGSRASPSTIVNPENPGCAYHESAGAAWHPRSVSTASHTMNATCLIWIVA